MIRHLLIYFVGALIAVMPIVCVVSGPRYPKDDYLFPFWGHILFAKMPFETVSYAIKISALDGQELKKKIEDYEVRKILNCGARSAAKLIVAMGSAKFHGHESEFLVVQGLFHKACFENKRTEVKYSLHRNYLNILEYWKYRRTITEVELGSFEFKTKNHHPPSI